jgi:hypothetical protein
MDVYGTAGRQGPGFRSAGVESDSRGLDLLDRMVWSGYSDWYRFRRLLRVEGIWSESAESATLYRCGQLDLRCERYQHGLAVGTSYPSRRPGYNPVQPSTRILHHHPLHHLDTTTNPIPPPNPKVYPKSTAPLLRDTS